MLPNRLSSGLGITMATSGRSQTQGIKTFAGVLGSMGEHRLEGRGGTEGDGDKSSGTETATGFTCAVTGCK